MPTARPPTMSSLVDELDTTAGRATWNDDHAEGPLRLSSKRPHVSCGPLAIVTPHNSVSDNEGRYLGGGFRTGGQSAGDAHRTAWLSNLRSPLAATEQATSHKRGRDPTKGPQEGGDSAPIVTGGPRPIMRSPRVIPRTLLTRIRTLLTRLGVIPRTLPTKLIA
jgi:hypothetical protein